MSGFGKGGIQKITSTGGSVIITNASGPVVNLEASGGAAGVASFNTRTGAVVLVAGDFAAGTGIGVSVSGLGVATISNAGVTSNVAGTGISVSGATGAVTITNSGVTSAVAGTGISVSGATGAVTFTNTGVTSIVAGNGIAISGATGAVTVSASAATITTQTTNYTLALADAQTEVQANSASAISVTVPANATVAFPVGSVINVRSIGAGQLTIVAAGGVTINTSSSGLLTPSQYETVSLIKTATNVWNLDGGGAASVSAGQGIIVSGATIGLNGLTNENIVATGGAAQTLAAVATDIGNDITLSANLTVTMPSAARGAYCYARVRQAHTGGPYTVTFTSVKWPGGTAPVQSTGADAIDLYEFQSDGTNWYGLIAGQAFA